MVWLLVLLLVLFVPFIVSNFNSIILIEIKKKDLIDFQLSQNENIFICVTILFYFCIRDDYRIQSSKFFIASLHSNGKCNYSLIMKRMQFTLYVIIRFIYFVVIHWWSNFSFYLFFYLFVTDSRKTTANEKENK